LGIRLHRAAWIDDHAHRAFAQAIADGQLRIVGPGGTSANNDSIHERAQAMQMRHRYIAINTAGTASRRRNTAIQGLAELRYHQRGVQTLGLHQRL
jgi:hypothetical protein